jgi:molecular chaperone DnaK
VVEEQPLIHSMGLALANNHYDKFFEKGRGLPLKSTRDFKTSRALRQGQSGELLRIPLIEGEQELADRNRKVGELEICAASIRRDLPFGSDLEVTLSISADRLIRITAYVPLLDETFEGKIDMCKPTATHAFLAADLEVETKRFQEAKLKANLNGADSAEVLVADIESSPLLEEVKHMIEAARQDPDAAAKCEKRLLELKLKLDEAIDAMEWPALMKQAQQQLSRLAQSVTTQGNHLQEQQSRELALEIDEAVRERKADRLRRKIDQVNRLAFEIVSAHPGFWVEFFQHLETQQHKMTDQPKAARLFEQGRECLAKNNLFGLQNIVGQIWHLLPVELQAQRGYQSGLIR